MRNLSRTLTERGHTVDILTVNTESVEAQEARPEGTVYRCGLDFSYHRGLISRELIAELFRRRSYDIIHVHIPFPLGLEIAALAARRNHIPLVVTHHGTGGKDDRLYTLIAGMYDRVYRRASLRLANRIVFLTESYRREVALAPKVRERTRIVRTGADTDAFSPAIDGAPVRSRYGFRHDDVVALWVGSLNEHNRYKGLNFLLDAIAIDAETQLKLLIVGEGPLKDELCAQAVQLGIDERIRFAGAIDNSNLPGYYAAADLFTLPSVQGPENSPVVVFEAMASGKPVVASNIAGVCEIVEHECTGLLVAPRDTTTLAAALGRLVKECELREQLGHTARAKALEHSWRRAALQVEQIYDESIVAGARPTHRIILGK